ncbi:branched-chain amino acid aminotransferase [Streptomyces sp. NPDC000410]|uniref:branched-chain amino acid aminotransferase n=1 Tax=Streptomyces sp. NPDC000410 TaxID=3154254 RepID=UPI0033219F86
MSKDNELVVKPTTAPRPKPEADTPLVLGRHFTDHAFSMRWTKRRAWQGLTIADRNELPALRPTSAALNYGQTVIEGIKAYRMNDGGIAVYRPDSHVKRLNNGARRLALPQLDFDRVWGALRRLVDLDRDWIPEGPGAALYLRLVLAGNGGTLDLAPADECLFYALAGPVGSAAEQGDRSARSMVVDGYATAWPGGTGSVRAAGNYGPNVVPGEIAANYGYDQVLWLDAEHQRFVKQLGTMNVFFVIDGVLTTPPLDPGILPGVTRDSVIKLARDAGVTVDERPVELAEVLKGIDDGRVTECFGTATETGITAVCEIGHKGQEHRIPGSTPGPVTARYRDLLDGLHRGDAPDRFGWMRRLTEVSPVHA